MKRPPPTEEKEKPPNVRQHTGRPNTDKRIITPTAISSLSFLSLAHQTQNDNATGLLGDFVGNSANELPCYIYPTPHDSDCQKDVTSLAELDAAIERERSLMLAADVQGDDFGFVDCYTRLLELYEAYFNTRRMVENGH